MVPIGADASDPCGATASLGVASLAFRFRLSSVDRASVFAMPGGRFVRDLASKGDMPARVPRTHPIFGNRAARLYFAGLKPETVVDLVRILRPARKEIAAQSLLLAAIQSNSARSSVNWRAAGLSLIVAEPVAALLKSAHAGMLPEAGFPK